MTVCVKRHSLVLVAGLLLAASSGGAAQQSSESDAVTPRISRLEQWLSAIALHRPGAVDEQVRLVNTWNQEEFEMLGNGPEARQSYERAATLAPMAQSPLFGLSRLAEQAGDRVAARDAVSRVLALPPNEFERSDPWWIYEVVQARTVDAMLADLRQRVAKLPE